MQLNGYWLASFFDLKDSALQSGYRNRYNENLTYWKHENTLTFNRRAGKFLIGFGRSKTARRG